MGIWRKKSEQGQFDSMHPYAIEPGETIRITETPWPNEQPLTVPEEWPEPVEVPEEEREKVHAAWRKKANPKFKPRFQPYDTIYLPAYGRTETIDQVQLSSSTGSYLYTTDEGNQYVEGALIDPSAGIVVTNHETGKPYEQEQQREVEHAYAEEMYGWKILKVEHRVLNKVKEDDPGSQAVLTSPSHHAVWPVGEPLRAEGWDPSTEVRNKPGIHTVDESHWDELYSYLKPDTVLVKCQLFGKIAHGERGVLRSQGAMPVLAVSPNKEMLLSIANAYGIDTELVGEESADVSTLGLIFEDEDWPGWELRQGGKYKGFDFGVAEGGGLSYTVVHDGKPVGTVEMTQDDHHADEITVNNIQVNDPDAAEFLNQYFYDKAAVWNQQSEQGNAALEDMQYELASWRDSTQIADFDDLVGVLNHLGQYGYDEYSYEWDESDIQYTRSDEPDEYGVYRMEATVYEPAPPAINFDPGDWLAIFQNELHSLQQGVAPDFGVAEALVKVPSFILTDQAQSSAHTQTESSKEWEAAGGLQYISYEINIAEQEAPGDQQAYDFLEYMKQMLVANQPVNPGQEQMFRTRDEWQVKPGEERYEYANPEIPGTFSAWRKKAMPVRRPTQLDSYLEGITGPGELHEDPARTGRNLCINPKCLHEFTFDEMEMASWSNGIVNCPKCGFPNQIEDPYESTRPFQKADPSQTPTGKPYEFNPGGKTRAGLTMTEMGDIGEKIALRLGDIPGIGPIKSASDSYNYAIDAIIETPKGKFGVEIKTNHSKAQERFKWGGAKERAEKIKYCLTNGLKPAILGIRLNFYTDKAYLFFREGPTDTWISNKQMHFVGAYDFSDLNPFKSPDPQAQAMAVDNAQLPDQSEEEEFDEAFGKLAWSEGEHPRDEEGQFTFTKDQHEMKIISTKGKHTHTIKRCPHCHVTYQKSVDHKGRFECPTCGDDPERDLKSASRIILGAVGENEIAKQLGWQFMRYSSNGKPVYNWQDANDYNHTVVGYGDHGKTNVELAQVQTSKRMAACMEGICGHATAEPASVETAADKPSFVVTAGQTAKHGGREQFVQEITGDMALVYDVETGAEDIVPVQELQAVGGWRARKRP